jgi:hypothetical protein
MFAKIDPREESKIAGLYLGWVVPAEGQWRPLMKTCKTINGYHSSHTRAYQRLASHYKGMAYLLSLPMVGGETITPEIPDVFTTRMPRLRPDTERECKFLGLSYPSINHFAFVARTGGTISGDPFDICPIMEPNEQGDYQFYCLLREVNSEIRTKLWQQPELAYTVVSEHQTIVTAVDSYLGVLPPYLSLLGEEISDIKLVNISDDFYLGDHTLISVTSKVNIYADPCFAGAYEEATV